MNFICLPKLSEYLNDTVLLLQLQSGELHNNIPVERDVSASAQRELVAVDSRRLQSRVLPLAERKLGGVLRSTHQRKFVTQVTNMKGICWG